MRLQGFGEFSMEGAYENPFENEKGKVKIPENSIQFIPDPKAKEDEGLVAFIAQNSGKIKPLAFSDLEDFLNIGKQLLNVSKQFYIEGLGTIILEGNGNMTFRQGNELIPAAAMAEHAVDNKQRDLTEEQGTDLSFEAPYNVPRQGSALKKLVATIGIIAAIAIIAWGGYYFWNHMQNSSGQTTPQNIQPILPDTAAALVDSAALKATTDSIAKPAEAPPYKIVIENAKRTRALTRYEDLKKMGYNVQLTTEDSLTFKLFTVINGPLTDSSRVRDSISRFFGRKVWVELP